MKNKRLLYQYQWTCALECTVVYVCLIGVVQSEGGAGGGGEDDSTTTNTAGAGATTAAATSMPWQDCLIEGLVIHPRMFV